MYWRVIRIPLISPSNFSKGACCWAEKQEVAVLDVPLLTDTKQNSYEQNSYDHRREMVAKEPQDKPIRVNLYRILKTFTAFKESHEKKKFYEN